jgi:two-component system response regulator (stage 0 sporulation protein F)
MKRESSNTGLQYLIYQFAERDPQLDFNPTKHSDDGGSSEEKSQAVLGVQKKRVVIVDDDVFVRYMFEKILGTHGFEIAGSMSDGFEIVDSIDKLSPMPDIIVLDERMPRMSGTEACGIIHARYPSISIIFVTADESAKERVRRAGARAILFKPVSASQLLEVINSI